MGQEQIPTSQGGAGQSQDQPCGRPEELPQSPQHLEGRPEGKDQTAVTDFSVSYVCMCSPVL